jgi:hypothetical protein
VLRVLLRAAARRRRRWPTAMLSLVKRLPTTLQLPRLPVPAVPSEPTRCCDGRAGPQPDGSGNARPATGPGQRQAARVHVSSPHLAWRGVRHGLAARRSGARAGAVGVLVLGRERAPHRSDWGCGRDRARDLDPPRSAPRRCLCHEVRGTNGRAGRRRSLRLGSRPGARTSRADLLRRHAAWPNAEQARRRQRQVPCPPNSSAACSAQGRSSVAPVCHSRWRRRGGPERCVRRRRRRARRQRVSGARSGRARAERPGTARPPSSRRRHRTGRGCHS